MLRTSSDVFIFHLGLHFEGVFWVRYILKGQIAFEGYRRSLSLSLSLLSKEVLGNEKPMFPCPTSLRYVGVDWLKFCFVLFHVLHFC